MSLSSMICGVADWTLVKCLYVNPITDGDWGKGTEGLSNGASSLKQPYLE